MTQETISGKVEDLLKPRYKVIANYPGSPFRVGEIWENREFIDGINLAGQILYNKGKLRLTEDAIKAYPHLFRKLEWWEERKIEEMPEYVKWIEFSPMNETKRLINAGCIEKSNPIQDGSGIYFDVASEVNSIRPAYFVPATQKEFEEYKSKNS